MSTDATSVLEPQEGASRPSQEEIYKEPSPEELLGEDLEVKLGADERTEAANNALRALARASRSYLIYDPRNEAIRKFLEEVKRTFEIYAKSFGDLDLHVRPFELMLYGETVYLERDRERSLAFKLFRDGVRRITIQAGVDWHELTQLLGVLSVRYVGIRQNPAEDDVVTLLWKAGFTHILLEAVEGFVPEDDEEEGAQMPTGIGADGMPLSAGDSGVPIGEMGEMGGEPTDYRSTALQAPGGGKRKAFKVPASFDLPLPDIMDEKVVVYRPLSDSEKTAVMEEDQSTYLPDLVLQLIHELLETATDPTDPLDFQQVVHLIRDARDFLLTENQLDTLLALFSDLNTFRENCIESELDEVNRLLKTMASTSAIARVLKTIPRNAIAPPDEFFQLLELMPGDALPALLELLETQREQSARRHLRIVIERYLPERADTVLDAYRMATGSVAADLMRLMAIAAPQIAETAVAELAASGDVEVQLEFLKVAENLPTSTSTRTLLIQLLKSTEEEVRIRALEVIVAMGERGSFRALKRFTETRAKKGASNAELDACGRALSRIMPSEAFKLYDEWSKHGGWFRRWRKAASPLRRVAIAGLGILDHEDVEKVLRRISSGGDDEERKAALSTLMRRQRERQTEDEA